MKKLYTVLLALVAMVSFPALAANFTMANYSFTPDPREPVATLKTITIHWEGLAEGIDYKVDPYDVGEYVTLTCGEVTHKAIAMYAGMEPATSPSDLVLEFNTITEPGKYVLHVAKGIVMDCAQFEADDTDYSSNGYIETSYTVTGGQAPESLLDEYVLDPKDGSTVASLRLINITFPKTESGEGIYEYGDIANEGLVTLTCGEKVYVCQSTNQGDDYSSLQFVFDPITEPGTYTLKIAAGTVCDTDPYEVSDPATQTNQEITATYIVSGNGGEEPEPTPESLMDVYTLDPMSGSTLASIKKIAIDFPKTYDESGDGGIGDPISAVTLTCGDKTFASQGFVMNNATFTGGYFVFDVTEAGIYTLKIPAGTFSNFADSSDKCGEITATYIVTGESGEDPEPGHTPGFMDDYTLDPKDGSTLESIEKITIDFPGALEEGRGGINYPLKDATLTCGDKVYALLFLINEDTYGGGTFVTEKAITEPGKYTLHIPEGTLPSYDDDSVVNPEITATYIISDKSGIGSIDAAADGKVTVVDLMGRVVLKDAPAEAVKTLDAGIYIVNGRKVAVK